jgi:hypothetical protein
MGFAAVYSAHTLYPAIDGILNLNAEAARGRGVVQGKIFDAAARDW